MSEREVARARHSETEDLLAVTVDDDGRLSARVASDDAQATFVGDLPSASRASNVVGRWRHFKGGEYEFLGLVDRSSDGPLVLYLDADGSAWLRPQAMIDEIVERDGWRGQRFSRITEQPSP